MRGLIIGVVCTCLGACGSTGNDTASGTSTNEGDPTFQLRPPAEGSEQYLRLCGRYGLGHLQSVAQSPDRKMLAIGGTDLALIFNDADGKILHRYRVDGGVRGVSFTPDGTKLSVATATQIQIFDVNLETVVASVKVPAPENGQSAQEFGPVIFAPDEASYATRVTG